MKESETNLQKVEVTFEEFIKQINVVVYEEFITKI